MGAPALDINWVLARIQEIKKALCVHPCNHPECDMGACTHPLKLLREMEEDITSI